jgi:hypothetical protein
MQYLGVFLCFLADKPTLIQKIICTDENTYGLSCIEAYRDGKVVHFLIDDQILCREVTGRPEPVFAQPQKNMYMWPCIIERAWLKAKGSSLKRLEQNSPEELFETLIPLPIQKYTFQDGMNSLPRSALNDLFAGFDCNGKEKGYILKSKRTVKRDIGISGLKYFYLLNTVVLDNRRLFYLRNPCGQPRFTGTHSTLTPQLQESLSARKLFIDTPGNFVIDDQ